MIARAQAGVASGLFLSLAISLCACAGGNVRPDYSEYVWPPPPDPPRIQLEDVIYGRADVEASSSLQRALLGATPDPFFRFRKPFAAAYDSAGRILVTDQGLAAVFRLDREHRQMDVLGRQGPVTLKVPLGLSVASDGTIYVADVGLKRVVAYDPKGKLRAVYGGGGELTNPTDAVVSPDGSKLYVTDSKAHRIAIFDLKTGDFISSFGRRGEGEGEFSFPTSLVFDGEGNLLVVDQLNSRVQILTEDGEFLDQFGSLGVGFGDFVRPKDVAVDDVGFIYVTDAAFNNIQLFDSDLTLLTFVGDGGSQPGQFRIASGIDVYGDEFVVADQLNRRVQVFRFLTPRRRQ